MEASSLVDFDESFFVQYNDEFDSLNDYYSQMGALGDVTTDYNESKISNVSIPMLSVYSLDDPIGYYRTFHDPGAISKTGGGFSVILVTEKGGHVGYPTNLVPWRDGWRWMSDCASSFAESVQIAKRGLEYQR